MRIGPLVHCFYVPCVQLSIIITINKYKKYLRFCSFIFVLAFVFVLFCLAVARDILFIFFRFSVVSKCHGDRLAGRSRQRNHHHLI